MTRTSLIRVLTTATLLFGAATIGATDAWAPPAGSGSAKSGTGTNKSDSCCWSPSKYHDDDDQKNNNARHVGVANANTNYKTTSGQDGRGPGDRPSGNQQPNK